MQAIYIGNGQEKFSLEEHKKKVAILKRHQRLNDILNKQFDFTWSHHEDPELAVHGIRIAQAKGDPDVIQDFVKALSYAAGYKCDFGISKNSDGELIAHIDVSQKGFTAVREALHTIDFSEYTRKMHVFVPLV